MNLRGKIILSACLIIVALLSIEKIASQKKRDTLNDNFDRTETLEEADNITDSADTSWWLNSGGQFLIAGGIGKTIQGPLPLGSKWQSLYSQTNSVDTENGFYPQNIFRLVNRNKLLNAEQSFYFKITADNLTDSPNRNESNGVLLFNRYLDGDNLYYCGLRVDGNVVVKKKRNGEYYQLAETKFLPGNYNRDSSPDLIPKNQWIGLKDVVYTDFYGNVIIKVFLDTKADGSWQQVLEAVDDNRLTNTNSILDPGYLGIRTDFMDVEFKDYYSKPI